jgi:hypothetical protein
MLRIIVLVLLFPLLIAACGSPDKPTANTAQFCQQAESVMHQAENGPPFTHHDWGKLMLAGARLIYVTKDCGDRVKESKPQLCADVRESMQVFIANPKIPDGINRATAINQNRRAYEKAACELPLPAVQASPG